MPDGFDAPHFGFRHAPHMTSKFAHMVPTLDSVMLPISHCRNFANIWQQGESPLLSGKLIDTVITFYMVLLSSKFKRKI